LGMVGWLGWVAGAPRVQAFMLRGMATATADNRAQSHAE
jgi:hypothetical protein